MIVLNFSIKTRFKRFFSFFQRLLFKKTLNGQREIENNGNLKHFVQKLKNQSVVHKILSDFVFRLNLLNFSFMPYPMTQHHNITIIW